MKIVIRLVLLCAFILGSSANAQPHSGPIYIGVGGSYSYGSPTTFDRSLGVIQTFSTSGLGTSWDNSFSLECVFDAPSVFSVSSGLLGSLGIASGSGQFKSVWFSSSQTLAPGGDTVLSAEDFRIYSRQSRIEFSAAYSYSLTSSIYFATGVWAHYRISERLDQVKEIIQPTPNHYPGKGAIDTIASGASIATSRFHFGIPIMFGSRFGLSKTMALDLKLFARTDLGLLAAGFAKPSLSAGLSTSVLFDLAAPSVHTEKPVVDTRPLSQITASVSFEVGGVSVRSVRPSIVDSTTRRYLVLTPTIEYSDDSAELPSGLVLLGLDQAQRFESSQLDRADLHTCQANLLNIIGSRLRDLPQEKLLVRATYRSTTRKSVALKRAMRIKTYFTEIWKIAASRIQVMASPDESAIETATLDGSGRLLSPLVNEWTEVHQRLPHIEIGKSITSNHGVQRWDVSVYDSSKLIGRYSNSSGSPVDLHSLDVRIGSGLQMLSTQLIAVDTVGTVASAVDTLVLLEPLADAPHVVAQTERYIVQADSLNGSQSWSSFLLSRLIERQTDSTIISVRSLSEGDRQSSGRVLQRLLELTEKGLHPRARIELEAVPVSVPNVPASGYVELVVRGSVRD
ncbi:MAG: hypothetical protein JSS75_12210 [Bacteroidetes bacterium]|nr:hypothetical protein [Bacteroidota bacterium]